MKIRRGYVSNSSSSSFIIALYDKKLSSDALLEAFQVSEESPLYVIAKEMAQVMTNKAQVYDEEEILYNFGYSSLDEAIKDGNKHAILLSKGFSVYGGYASDDDGGVEAMVCNTKINFESDTLVIQSEGGY